MTSAISQLVYMPNFRAIGQSVWEKNGNTQKHRQKDRNTDLNFIKIDIYVFMFIYIYIYIYIYISNFLGMVAQW